MATRVHQDWLLTHHRVAIHEPTRSAVIADVHLGYREARQNTGDAVPLLDVAAQMLPLRRAHRDFHFSRLVVAGDLFERGVDLRLLQKFLAELASMQVAFAGLAPGNHDRGWESIQELAPVHPQGVMLGDWRIVHEEPESPGAIAATADAAPSPNLVLGHWHPAVRYQRRRLPCYLVGPGRIILPAFSCDAAGVTVRTQSAWRGLQCFGILDDRVFDCSKSAAASATKNPRRDIRGFRRGTGAADPGRI